MIKEGRIAGGEGVKVALDAGRWLRLPPLLGWLFWRRCIMVKVNLRCTKKTEANQITLTKTSLKDSEIWIIYCH